MNERCFVVTAGFPSPAETWQEAPLNLNETLLASPDSTYFVRVKGHSMQGAGIFDNDILLVDRTLDVHQDNIVVACLHRAFTIKRIRFLPDVTLLCSDNPRYPPFAVTPAMGFFIWGVVVCVIHPLHSSVRTRLQPGRS